MLIHNATFTGSFSYNGVDISTITSSVDTSASFATRVASLESTASVLTAASGTLDARVISLESTASILTAASASLSITSGSLNATSESLSTASGSLNAGLVNVIARTGSFATTGSNVFYGNQTVSASMFVSGSITATGQIVAQTINVQSVTSSVVYSSGSNVFGNKASDTQQMTGSLLVSGSTALFNVGCVGIGTASPNTKLDVYSSTAGTATIGRFGAANYGIAANKTYIQIGTQYDDGSSRIGSSNPSGNLSELFFETATATSGVFAERMRITSAGITCFSARVCAPSLTVSTTNAVLTIQGTATPGEAQLDLEGKNSGGTVRSAVFKYDSSDIIRLGTSSNITMRFETNDTTRLCIMNTGIAVFACQVCAPNLLISNCATIGTVGFSYPEFNLAVTPTMTVVGNGTGPVGEGIYFKRTSNLCQGGWISGNGGALYIAGQNKHASAFGDIYFGSNNGSTTCDIMVVDGNNRRVGIGTTTPCTTLTVEGANSAFPLTYNSGYGNIHIQTNETTATQNYGGTLTFGGLGRTSGPTEKFIWAAIAGRKQTTKSGDPKGYLQFGTLNDDTNQIAERMRITACGNVGIGITADNPIANGGTFRNLLVGNGAGYGVFQGISTATATDSTVAAFGGGTTGASGFKNAGSINIELDGTSTTNATGRIAFYTGAGGTIAERMRITSGGNVGIGTSNPNVYGTGFTNQFTVSTTSGYANITVAGSSGNSGGIDFGNQTVRHSGIYALDGSNLAFYTNGSNSGSGLTERMRITSAGYLYVGKCWGDSFHRITRLTSEGGAVLIVSGYDTSQNNSIQVNGASGASANTPATVLWVATNSSTSRSINAGGTINASGADYAEYMTKAIEDNIAKGDIVGVNAQGKLTNIFDDAISFVVKSTDPSYVGGDTWGNEEIIGQKRPTKTTDETEEEFASKLSAFEAKLEEARAKVDRISFSGQIPCNVYGANVGDYIIPIKLEDGKIGGQAVSNPNLEQYKISVGKVWKIMNDGRAWIAVKIG